VQEPPVHRPDERVAVRRRGRDSDGLHAVEQLHDLLRGQRVLAGMDDRRMCGFVPGVALVDEACSARISATVSRTSAF
jgi:hypothetical protein